MVASRPNRRAPIRAHLPAVALHCPCGRPPSRADHQDRYKKRSRAQSSLACTRCRVTPPFLEQSSSLVPGICTALPDNYLQRPIRSHVVGGSLRKAFCQSAVNDRVRSEGCVVSDTLCLEGCIVRIVIALLFAVVLPVFAAGVQTQEPGWVALF